MIKYIVSLLILGIWYTMQGRSTGDNFEVTVQPAWNILDSDTHQAIQLGGAWVHAGIISIKKKTQDAVYLDSLTLIWYGDHIKSLSAALYRKPLDKLFLPIEQNLICDSSWIENQQKLVFRFNQSLLLEPLTTYYIVLTIPSELEITVKHGSFAIARNTLPPILQESITKQPLTLAFADII